MQPRIFFLFLFCVLWSLVVAEPVQNQGVPLPLRDERSKIKTYEVKSLRSHLPLRLSTAGDTARAIVAVIFSGFVIGLNVILA